jgi:hypothetical protein
VLSRDARTVTQDKRAELAALRKAFCGAIAKGQKSTAAERSLLTYCRDLSGDLMAMPRETVKAINEFWMPKPKLEYGASFAEGAVIVTALIRPD